MDKRKTPKERGLTCRYPDCTKVPTHKVKLISGKYRGFCSTHIVIVNKHIAKKKEQERREIERLRKLDKELDKRLGL